MIDESSCAAAIACSTADAPGSWLQVAAERVGPRGIVVGIDLQPLSRPVPGENIRTLVGDLRQVEPDRLLTLAADGDRRFDVVLSDMAPSTSGDRSIDHHQSVRLCKAVLERCDQLLRPGGRLVMKVLEGEAYPASCSARSVASYA